MYEKIGFWKKLKKNRKSRILFFCIGMIVLVGLYIPAIKYVKMKNEMKITGISEISADDKVLCEIEEIEKQNKKLVISGWMIRLGSYNAKIRLGLREVGGETFKLYDTKKTERTDVTSYFGLSEDFKECGFSVRINENDLLTDKCYEVLLVLDYAKSSTKKIAEMNKQPFDSHIKYIRMAINSKEWEPWYKFESVLVDE